jgi:L-fuconolactonase
METFGPSRPLFGGDWPVMKSATPHPARLSMARTLPAQLSAREQAANVNGSARRVHRPG